MYIIIHTNTLARLNMPTLQRVECRLVLRFRFKAEIRIKEVRITHCDRWSEESSKKEGFFFGGGGVVSETMLFIQILWLA